MLRVLDARQFFPSCGYVNTLPETHPATPVVKRAKARGECLVKLSTCYPQLLHSPIKSGLFVELGTECAP